MITKDYNTISKPVILPEYGRNIQNMVDHCLTIRDRAERQRCAEAIIDTMRMVSTRDKEGQDYMQVLWDHLNIMSDFKLDIDFPFPVITREAYEEKVERSLDNDHQHKPAYRHYGRIIERMIQAVLDLPEGDERQALACETAIQMKRCYTQWNKETVANAKIFADLYELSEGKIYLDETLCHLPDVKELNAPNNIGNTNNNNQRRSKNLSNNRRKKR